jgi:hypothetical protein
MPTPPTLRLAGQWPTCLLTLRPLLPTQQPAGRQLQMCLGDLQQTKQNTFLLEPHLAKKKKKKTNQKEETKLKNPEHSPCEKLLQAMLY